MERERPSSAAACFALPFWNTSLNSSWDCICPSMFGAQEDGLLVGAVDLDAMGFDAGIVFEGVVDDAAIEGVERLEFHDIAPASDLFRGLLSLLDQGVAGLGAITADVNRDFGRGRVLLK